MRVTFNDQSSSISTLQTAAEHLARAQREVSTGRRVSVASDDPSAARTIVQERAEMATIDAYRRSADTASSRLSAADTALSGIIDLYTEAMATATAGRGSVPTQEAREALAQQIRSIRDSLLTQINAQFAGRPLFAGSATSGSAYAGTPGAWNYQGTADTVQVEVQQDRVVSVTFDGRSILQGSDADSVLTSLDALSDALVAGDAAGISAGIDAIDRAMGRAARAQGRLGADERGLGDAVSQLTALRLSSDTRRSQAEDANLAEAITKLSSADTAYRATLAAISRQERETLLDYLR